MKSLLFLLGVWGCLGMVQCQDDAVAPEVPAACTDSRAQPLIDELLQTAKGNPAGEVWRYTWEGRTVFLVKPTHPDGYAKLYDLTGGNQLRYVGAPSGGLSGKGDGKCPTFTAQATSGCQLWLDIR